MTEYVNTNKSDDPFFRYKMIKLKSKFIGKGNGCKTILENLEEVSKSIGQPKLIIFKHIGNKLGARINESDNSITGHITNETLMEEIYDYITFFLNCAICNLPETIPEILEISKKNKTIRFNCRACGEHYQLYNPNSNQVKTINNIVKYLENKKWTTVESFSKDKDNQLADDSDDDFNPF